jgi:enoyl-CoA hydratase/carnithine racemase
VPAITGMMGGFVLLLHIPRVIAAPDSRMEWTMTAVALTLTGAAFALWRGNVEAEQDPAPMGLPSAPANQ